MANNTDSTDFAEGHPPNRIAVPRSVATSAKTMSEPSCLRVFFAWEVLRLFYNLPMAAIFLGFFARAATEGGVEPSVHSLLGCGGVFFLIVNAPFCLCHAVEVYLCWLGMRRSIARAGIFTLITCVIGGAFASLIFMK